MNKYSTTCLKYLLTILLCIANTAVVADNFGRLLTTPDEREEIRSWRSATLSETQQSNPESAVAQDLRFNGMILRANGKTSIWINGQWVNSTDQASRYGIVSLPAEHNGLGISAKQHDKSTSTETIYLKPGQYLNRQTQTATEGYKHPSEPEASPQSALIIQPAESPSSR